MRAIPDLIRGARSAAGLTQAELAARLGVTQGAVAQLERPGANPTVARLDEVLGAMGRRLVLGEERRDAGIDETLLARNLRMTAAERLAAFETAHSDLAHLRSAMRDAR